MNEKISIILITPSSSAHAAAKLGLPLAHMAYRVSPGLRLLRSNLRAPAEKDYMVLTDAQYLEEGGSAAQLAREIAGECSQFGFRGVVADFAQPPSEGLIRFIREAPRILKEYRLPLYTNENYAGFSPDVRALVPANVSGGALRSRLEDAIKAYGLGRVAIDAGRLCHDYTLPMPDQVGKRLEKGELQALKIKYHPMVFYSNELCANYFTYRDEGNGMHFVLFDDAHSISKKLYTARMLGISEAFLLYPEVEDILPDILSRVEKG